MSSTYKEISFELEICQHLANNGWLYADGDAAGYDRARAIFPADILAWVQSTQAKAWETLTKNHGSKAEETLLIRLRDQLDQRGTLDVLRHGVELLGLKNPLLMAQFKPALAINPDLLERFTATHSSSSGFDSCRVTTNQGRFNINSPMSHVCWLGLLSKPDIGDRKRSSVTNIAWKL